LAEHPIRGTFEVICNGASLRLGPPNRRARTAILLPNAGQIVPTDRIGVIWGDRDPGTDRLVDVRVDAHCSNEGIDGDCHRARAGGPGCG
jgi:hypothetical protein